MPVILDNPVINAYIQGIKMKREQDQSEFDRTQKKEEGARAQEHLKGYLSHLKAEEAHANSALELQQKQLGLQSNSHTLEATKWLSDMQNKGLYQPGKGPAPTNVQDTSTIGTQQVQKLPISMPGDTGGDTNNQILGMLPQQQQQIQPGITAQPGTPSKPIEIAPGVSYNPDDLTGHAGLLQQELSRNRALGQVQAETAGAVTKATQTAEEPFDISKSERASTAAQALETIKAKDARLLREQGDKAKLQQIGLTNEGRRAAASISAEARKYAADKAHIINPDEVANNAILHATGQGGAELGNTPRDIATKLVLSKQGLVSFSAKDAEKLKAVHALDPLYDEMINFVKNLPTTTVNALGQKVLAKIPATMLKNFEAKVRGVSGNVSKTMGGESGRLSEDDVKRSMGLLVTPGMTQEMALDRIKFFSQNTYSKVMDQTLGGQSDHQKLLNLTTFNFDPDKFNSVIKVGTESYNKFQKNPAGDWGVFNRKTLHYDPIGAK